MEEIVNGGADENENHIDEVAQDQMEAPVLGAAQHSPRRSDDSDEKLPGSVYVIVFALIIDLIGFALILPLLPAILEYYKYADEGGLYSVIDNQINRFQTHYGIPRKYNSVLFGGVLGSLFSLLQFLFSPIIGSLSDVYGRKPVLLLVMVGISLSHFIWIYARHFYIFVIARIVGGISRGNISLSTAIVTDLCSPKLRVKGMALIGITFAVGFMLGPTVGAVLSVLNKEDSFLIPPQYFAFGLAVFDVFFLMAFFKESLPPEKRATSVTTGLADAFSYINPMSIFSFTPVQNISVGDRALMQRIGWIYFLHLFIYSGLEFNNCFLAYERFEYSSMDQAYIYLFSGVVMSFIQGTLVRRAAVGTEMSIALQGIFAAMLSFIVIGLSRNTLALYVGLVPFSFASATVVPCFSTVISKLGSDNQKGTSLGTFRSLGYLARGLGPSVAALGYWCLGSAMCYCLGGLLFVVPLYLLYELRKDMAGMRVHEKTH